MRVLCRDLVQHQQSLRYTNRPDFEAAGCEQFIGHGTPMPYFEVPSEVLEDADELEEWVRKAQAAARRAAKRKPAKKKAAGGTKTKKATKAKTAKKKAKTP